MAEDNEINPSYLIHREKPSEPNEEGNIISLYEMYNEEKNKEKENYYLSFNIFYGSSSVGKYLKNDEIILKLEEITDFNIQENLLKEITRSNLKKNQIMKGGAIAGTYLYADLPEISFATKVKNRKLNGIEENPLIFYDLDKKYDNYKFSMNKIPEYVTSNSPLNGYDYHHVLIVFGDHIDNLLIYPKTNDKGQQIIKDDKIQYDFKIDDSSLKHLKDSISERKLTSILRGIPGLKYTISISPGNTLHGSFPVQGIRGYNCTSFATNKYAQIRQYKNINKVLENHLLIHMNSLASVSKDLQSNSSQDIIKLGAEDEYKGLSYESKYIKASIKAGNEENCFLIKKDTTDNGCFNLSEIQKNLPKEIIQQLTLAQQVPGQTNEPVFITQQSDNQFNFITQMNNVELENSITSPYVIPASRDRSSQQKNNNLKKTSSVPNLKEKFANLSQDRIITPVQDNKQNHKRRKSFPSIDK